MLALFLQHIHTILILCLLFLLPITRKLAKISFSGDSFTESTATVVVVSTVASGRQILGVAFDFTDDKNNPTVYCTANEFFHGEDRNSYGDAINGKILAVNGANLDQVTEVITGLPVSDLDHGLNNIIFGDVCSNYVLGSAVCGVGCRGGGLILPHVLCISYNSHPFVPAINYSTESSTFKVVQVSTFFHCAPLVLVSGKGDVSHTSLLSIVADTNGGVPGQLSGSQKMRENYFSA